MRKGFTASGLAIPEITLVRTNDPLSAADLLIRREGRGFSIHFSAETPPLFLPQLFDKCAAFTHWLDHAAPDVREILAGCTDGEGPSNARYANIDAYAQANPVRWSDRHNRIIWR